MRWINAAINEAMLVVQSGDIKQGIEPLICHAQLYEPDSVIWDNIRKIPFIEDSILIYHALSQSMLKVGSEITEFYFGLDGINMLNGKGIEMGGGKGEHQYCAFRDEIPSIALEQFYNECLSLHESASFVAEYTIAMGYLGLALRAAFTQISSKIAATSLKKRTVVFGFHDGDLWPLGTLDEYGFKLSLKFPENTEWHWL